MKLWKVLSLKVNSYEISKVLSSSVSCMLTLAWGIDILFEKLTPEIGGGDGGGDLKKLFAMNYASGGGYFMQSLPWF